MHFFDRTRPYQQIPFQYSLHYLKIDGGKLKHHEFLSSPNCDPRKELTEKLISKIPDNAWETGTSLNSKIT
ncbi:MAG: DUF2779 domain-containing protein [Deltaproteobacteria bacterium]|nr:DUF2779 domain-containing protein [Deltaproteobacteria bacterium]